MVVKQIKLSSQAKDKLARLKGTDLKSIYYECKQTTEQNNVDSLSELIGEAFNFPKPAFENIENLLRFLFKSSEQKPLILVLDEYSYLRENVKGLDSILQSVIDSYKDTSKIKLIICGSYVDTMKALLAKQNPLYGRIDLTINLKPMDYYDSALFYSDFSDEDKVRLFSVFGGIPYYNRLIDAQKSVRENIIDLIASPGARLENEVSMYLNSEISKITNANEVFEALAKGFSRYKDLLNQSNVSSGPALVDILDKLIRMDVVAKEAPINDENNRKKSGYFISDNLSLFYYKYIFMNVSRMNIMDPDVFYDEDGRMWMVYGSWSGGIFMIEIDEDTGYPIYPEADEENHVDSYYGKKLLGGYHNSIEGPHIMYDETSGYYYGNAGKRRLSDASLPL